MTDEPRETPPPRPDEHEQEQVAELSDEEAPALRALLKRSLAAPDAHEMGGAGPSPASAASPPAETEALVRGVQRKLRQRSKGKFYADGWSTTQSRVSYAVVAIVMLFTIAVVYFALGPTGIH
jgi:hypothetical protein